MKVGDITKYAFAFVVQNQSSSVVLLPPGKVTAVTVDIKTDYGFSDPYDSYGFPKATMNGATSMTAKVSGVGISDFTVDYRHEHDGSRRTPWQIVLRRDELHDVRGVGRTDKGLPVAFRIWKPDHDLMAMLFGSDMDYDHLSPKAFSGDFGIRSPRSNALAAPAMRALE